MVFAYKSKGDVIWPLHKVLKTEGFSSLTKIFAAMKRTGGFTTPAKQMVLRRIQEIQNEWNSDDSLPRKLKIPYTGNKIHYEPEPVLEFRDNNGTRRFFRPKDQLKISSIKTLKTLQSKLKVEVEDGDKGFIGFSKSRLRFLKKSLSPEEDLLGTTELLRLEEQTHL